MKALHLHGWDVTPTEAREIQLQLRSRFEREDCITKVKHVAGAEVVDRQMRFSGNLSTAY